MIYRAAIVVSLCVLGACGSTPPRQLETLSEVTLASDQVSLAVADAVSDGEGLPPQEAITAEVSTPQTGFLGGLFGRNSDTSAPQAAPISDTAQPRNAGLLGGLFGGGKAGAPAAPQVTSDIVLPFGQIAANCTVTKNEMGTLVDKNAGYAIYDTAPNVSTLRTHYVTGFKDDCARQFSAATALMGDVGTHEVVRYLPSNAKHPYSAADDAYELIKASYCGAVRGQPCGAKLDRLARNATFITAYESFSDNAEWADMFLHNGAVAAIGPVAR